MFVAEDGTDPVLAVRTPNGDWMCNDDGPEGLDPVVDIDEPTVGDYEVWVGSFAPDTPFTGSLYITERDIQPSDL